MPGRCDSGCDLGDRPRNRRYQPYGRPSDPLGRYSYDYEHYAAGPSRVTVEDEIHQCVHYEISGTRETYTYCANCGSINCEAHTKTERLEGTPVCTGCAVIEQFVFSTKYFYDRANLETFRQEYDRMPFYEKPMENPPLVAGALLTAIVVIVGVLTLVL